MRMCGFHDFAMAAAAVKNIYTHMATAAGTHSRTNPHTRSEKELRTFPLDKDRQQYIYTIYWKRLIQRNENQ
jgi:hypothetical protein